MRFVSHESALAWSSGTAGIPQRSQEHLYKIVYGIVITTGMMRYLPALWVRLVF
jgi:hypothetical protein